MGATRRKGYIQVYTGDSKGKTTAALGLALRAAGAGHRTFIAQFIKKGKSSEHKALERFKDLIEVRQYGTGFIRTEQQLIAASRAAVRGLEAVKEIFKTGNFDVVILDEINVALFKKLIPLEEVLSLIDMKPKHVELVLTGRYAPEEIIEKADLVTEMKEVKHYYSSGVKARKGIEF
ncbi:MAG: cob(I)yrinic acid a,c-diamide adenosyltransferase [Thermodesulfovibrionales bacterium]|nr:cob(I)yrinic acid a,c-diamide adenosyltransferase [Thermodesulfovibrionales bacterium]